MGAIQQALLAYGAAAAAGPTYLTAWNPTDVSTNVTFSNSDATATLGSNDTRVTKSMVCHAAGKRYAEFVIDEYGASSTGYSVGLCKSDMVLSGVLLGGNTGSIGARDTIAYINNANVGTPWASRAEGNVVCMAVDLDADLIWFKNASVSANWNNSGSADPATGTGGISIASIADSRFSYYASWSADQNTAAVTLRTQADAFTETAPSGFAAWDAGGVHFRGASFRSTASQASLPENWKVGDQHFIFVESANEAIATPSGWTAVTNAAQGAGTAASATATRISVFHRTAQSGDTTVTLTGATNHAFAFVLGFFNVDATTQIDATPAGDAEASSTTSVTFPSVTTVTDGARVMFAVTSALDSATQQLSTATFAGLTDIHGPYFFQATSANGGGLYVFLGTKTTAGSTGTGSATLASASLQGRTTIPLRPA
jgi:hypothetical protein